MTQRSHVPDTHDSQRRHEGRGQDSRPRREADGERADPAANGLRPSTRRRTDDRGLRLRRGPSTSRYWRSARGGEVRPPTATPTWAGQPGPAVIDWIGPSSRRNRPSPLEGQDGAQRMKRPRRRPRSTVTTRETEINLPSAPRTLGSTNGLEAARSRLVQLVGDRSIGPWVPSAMPEGRGWSRRTPEVVLVGRSPASPR